MPTADHDIQGKGSHAGGNMNLVDFLESNVETSVKIENVQTVHLGNPTVGNLSHNNKG